MADHDGIENLMGALDPYGRGGAPKPPKDARPFDPMYDLKVTVFDFFKSHMNHVGKTSELKRKAEEKLLEKLDMDELDFDQIMQVLHLTGKDINMASESIIGLFKPVPGAPSPLSTSTVEAGGEADGIEQAYASLTPAERDQLDGMFRASLAIINERKKSSGS